MLVLWDDSLLKKSHELTNINRKITTCFSFPECHKVFEIFASWVQPQIANMWASKNTFHLHMLGLIVLSCPLLTLSFPAGIVAHTMLCLQASTQRLLPHFFAKSTHKAWSNQALTPRCLHHGVRNVSLVFHIASNSGCPFLLDHNLPRRVPKL